MADACSWIYGNEGSSYGPDMFMNLVFYSTGRKLIDDVEIFHRIKGSFRDLRNHLEYLIVLIDFVDRFGANIGGIQEDVWDLQDMERLASQRYVEQDFRGAQEALDEASGFVMEAEALAKRVKDSALW